jgi:endophilin-B
MDMFTKTFDRAKQTVEEKFGDAAKTEFDPELQTLLQKTDDIKMYTEKMVGSLEIFLQPDPAIRILPGLTHEGLNKPEALGAEMGHLGAKLQGSPYGTALKAGEQAYSKIGASEREFLAAAHQQYMIPVKRFLNEDLKTLENERKLLSNRRLDMDCLKWKAAKNPDNSAVQQDMEKAQTGFTDQSNVVRELIKTKIEAQMPELQKALKALVAAKLEHMKKCQKLLEDFNKQL